MTPKISVIMPLYNRKHYVADSINSVLNQTFQDFELIIRDDCSTDGSYEFVKEKYSKQISSGKIKLLRNERNIGEFRTDNRLIKETTAKYLMIIHSDDLYLSHGMQHLFEVAEQFNADVVHSSFFLNSPKDGTINKESDLKLTCWDSNPVKKIELLSDDPQIRFNEWLTQGTFHDAPYNIFKRSFIIENDLSFDSGGNKLLGLWWIMLAKVLVKTPIPFYVRRDSPDSQTNAKDIPAEKIERFISTRIELLRKMDKRFNEIAFFQNNEIYRYMAKANFLMVEDNFEMRQRGVYKNGITPEIYQAVKDAFQKHFGEDYFYPMFLFQWLHVLPFNKSLEVVKN